MKGFCLLITLLLAGAGGWAQKNLVFVDKQGVLRWSDTHREAAFFGVNYTAPFAYSYRAHQARHADLEEAIRQDVYHMSRLGLDAFRVHVWDTEISDSLGNLLDNEHLRLFDYLVAELARRKIRIIITPIAFWGNGYPERDEQTPGFSRVFGKGRATVNDTAIRAQENYLGQLFKHVNPYTHQTYVQDPDVLAVELNNEPSHSGPKSGVTAYINRLAAAIRSTGWTKPLFYNISQNPYYADAVAAAAVDGFSFQWYPTGLVGGSILKGNYLPNVDRYLVPFDTIPAFRNKSRMVYEFDAADVLQSDMYPAIARSFRGAGFQWATQFAYDPMALAYANTEYQTHYLNLAYTPSKAISLLIASEAFHTLPRSQSYGSYPADSVFGAFRVSYRQDLSELNTTTKFYYSNNTTTQPLHALSLEHVAGVGSSPLVTYRGTGAYFLDKVAPGAWRLEVMPDVLYIRDPFAKASPKREATRVQWDHQPMRVMLPDLGDDFAIKGIDSGNVLHSTNANGFSISPGVYLLSRPGAPAPVVAPDFAAPKPYATELFAWHQPFTEVTGGRPFTVSATIAGLDTGRAWVQVGRRMIPMARSTAAVFTAEVPADLVTPGLLTYRIILEKGGDYATFPGDSRDNPFAWDNVDESTYSTFVAAENGRLEVFNPGAGQPVRTLFRRGFRSSLVTGEMPARLILRLTDAEQAGFQIGFTEQLKGRSTELPAFGKLFIRARGPGRAKVTLTDADAFSYSSYITLSGDFQDIPVPLEQMAPDSAWLMPRPYPGFQPLWFKASGAPPPFSLGNMEKIQITLEAPVLEVASIWLEK